MVTGSYDLSQSLRQQCSAELYVNAGLYADHACLKSKSAPAAGSDVSSTTAMFGMVVSTPSALSMNNASMDDKVRVVKDEAKLVAGGGEPSLLQAAALATVIKRPIHSLCLDQVRQQCQKSGPCISMQFELRIQ